MKVVYFYDGNRFFMTEVPYFEWDIEGAKYLMSVAADARKALIWPTENEQKQYEQVQAVLDLVHKLRFRFNYETPNNNPIQEYVNKGYDKYCEVLDKIATNLAAELYCLSSLSLAEDEKKKAYYWNKISDYETKAYKLLGELKEGKLIYALEDGKTRSFNFRYSTSNILEYKGKLFYAPDTRNMKDFEGEVEREFYK